MPRDAVPSFIFAESIGEAGDELVLTGEEAHYVGRVCRAEAGASLHVTDGRGTLARLTLSEVRPRVRAVIASVERQERPRASTLWCGAPEGSRADWLVEKIAELGAGTLQPVDTERSAWRLPAARLERWHRLTIAALRQSRQSWRMEIREPQPLHSLLGAALPGSLWLADPSGTTSGRAPAAGEAIGAIGPAGGFSEAERDQLLASGFTAICLGPSRLRAETAALAWTAWWARG